MVLHLRAQGLEERDEHQPMLSCGAWLTFPYLRDILGKKLNTLTAKSTKPEARIRTRDLLIASRAS